MNAAVARDRFRVLVTVIVICTVSIILSGVAITLSVMSNIDHSACIDDAAGDPWRENLCD